MLCRPFRARAESGHRSQGVALGCRSVPLQGRENAQRIGLSEVPACGDRQSTLRTVRREACPPDDTAESVTYPD